MLKKKRYLPRNEEIDQERIVELIRVYRDGVDWKRAYQLAIDKLNEKFTEKLADAKMSGGSAKKLASIQKKWDNALATEPTLIKLSKMAETMPNPTTKQKFESDDAANELVIINEKLVIYMIRKHFGSYVNTNSYDDIQNVGRLGLFQSLMSYDSKKGMFSTYAAYFIKNAIYGYLSELHGSSTYYQSQAKHYKDVIAKLLNEGNTAPTASDIAGEMGVGFEAVQRLMSVMSRANPLSLNDESVTTRPIDPLKFNPEEITARNEVTEMIEKALSELPEIQRLVIDLLYLESDKPSKYSVIGMKLAQLENPDVPESELKPYNTDRIRQIKAEALRALKAKLSKYYNDSESNYITRKSALRINIYPDTSSIVEDLDFIHDCC